MRGIIPNLWFDGQALEAAEFYCSVFDRSEITAVARYTESSPGPTGEIMTVEFVLDGVRFVAINGGPEFQFTEALSLQVDCEDQAEIDRYWSALTDGGEEVQCGWLKDRFGVSWQIVPADLEALVSDADPERADRAMASMLSMVKIDIDEIRRAAQG